jgi:hypothetical protein
MSQEKRSLGPEGYSIVSMANLNLKRFIKYKEKRPGLRKWAKKATIPVLFILKIFYPTLCIKVFFLLAEVIVSSQWALITMTLNMSAATGGGAPKIKKNASRKNKKSWRKNVDMSAVEEYLEEKRFDERIGKILMAHNFFRFMPWES